MSSTGVPLVVTVKPSVRWFLTRHQLGIRKFRTDLLMHVTVTLTYPHIGNVGVNQEDTESHRFTAGLVVRGRTCHYSNWRAEESRRLITLFAIMLLLIVIIDTRRTRYLARKGAQRGCIMAGENLSVEHASSCCLLPWSQRHGFGKRSHGGTTCGQKAGKVKPCANAALFHRCNG